MKYKIRQERKNPEPGSLELIDNTISNIEPDNPDLLEWYFRYSRMSRKRFAYDIDYAKKYIMKNGKIMEVGAAPFLLTASLQKLGFSIHAIDIAPERFSNAVSSFELNVRKNNIETEILPFSDGEFDAAIVNEVFEHLRINPIFTFNEVHRVLKQNGVLLLSTPNLRSLDKIVSLIFRGRMGAYSDIYTEYNKLHTLGHMGHVRFYTAIEVCVFLEKIGFTIIEIIYRGIYNPKATWKKFVNNFPFISAFPSLRPKISIVAQKK